VQELYAPVSSDKVPSSSSTYEASTTSSSYNSGSLSGSINGTQASDKSHTGEMTYSSCAQLCVRLSMVGKASFIYGRDDIRMIAYKQARDRL
jgi:hypothetical protein